MPPGSHRRGIRIQVHSLGMDGIAGWRPSHATTCSASTHACSAHPVSIDCHPGLNSTPRACRNQAASNMPLVIGNPTPTRTYTLRTSGTRKDGKPMQNSQGSGCQRVNSETRSPYALEALSPGDRVDQEESVVQESRHVAYPLVVFFADTTPFALDLSVGERVLPMVAFSPLSSGIAVVLGAINLHGEVVPVFDLRQRTGLPEREYGPDDHLLVARANRRVVALPVDEVAGVRWVDSAAVRAPEEVAPGLARVNGVMAVEDGVLLICDLNAFLTSEEELELERALEKGGT